MKKRIFAPAARLVARLASLLVAPFSLRRFRATGTRGQPSGSFTEWLVALSFGLFSVVLKLLITASCVALALGAWQIHTNQAQPWHLYTAIASAALLTVAGTVYLMHNKLMRRAAITLGCLLILSGITLLNVRSHQLDAYNKGIAALDDNELKEAVQCFDESLAAARASDRQSGLAKLVLPASDRYLEARTYFHKASALIKLSKGKEALQELKNCLRLNPGNCFFGMSAEESAQLYYDALCAQSNLEKLFKSGQGNGGRAKGKGQPGNKPGDRSEDGNQPGNQPGRLSRDTI